MVAHSSFRIEGPSPREGPAGRPNNGASWLPTRHAPTALAGLVGVAILGLGAGYHTSNPWPPRGPDLDRCQRRCGLGDLDDLGKTGLSLDRGLGGLIWVIWVV